MAAAALRGWALVASTLPACRMGADWVERALGGLEAGLHAGDVDVRGAAGEAITLLFHSAGLAAAEASGALRRHSVWGTAHGGSPIWMRSASGRATAAWCRRGIGRQATALTLQQLSQEAGKAWAHTCSSRLVHQITDVDKPVWLKHQSKACEK